MYSTSTNKCAVVDTEVSETNKINLSNDPCISDILLRHFNIYRNYFIFTQTDKAIAGLSVEDCARRCVTNLEYECLSFSYCFDVGDCFLSHVHADNSSGIVQRQEYCDLYSRKLYFIVMHCDLYSRFNIFDYPRNFILILCNLASYISLAMVIAYINNILQPYKPLVTSGLFRLEITFD
jgi:hypothetical protein